MEPIINLGNPNETGLKEYIVTLNNMEDSESFYTDMETEGGNLYIPNRIVECANRRPISRNTHYMLTYSEALEIRKDPRVLTVELNPKDLGITFSINGFTQTSEHFSKNALSDSDDINWGLLRSRRKTDIDLWGVSGSVSQTETVNSSTSGKNVDVVILDDGSPWPHVLEYAQNPDGTGYSRMVEYNWYQHNEAILGPPPSYATPSYYNYSHQARRMQEHGGHVTGTVAGNTQGWARDANIYNLSFNDPVAGIDYVREFHRNKPINPLTGLKNPTIMNNSWGTSTAVKYYPEYIEKMVIRGVEYNAPIIVRDDSLFGKAFEWGKEFYALIAMAGAYIYAEMSPLPVRVASIDQDIIDAMREGIIVVAAAGNDGLYVDSPGGPDYDNYFVYYGNWDYEFNRTSDTYYFNRGMSPGSAAGINDDEKVICVGAMGDHAYQNIQPGTWAYINYSALYSDSHEIENTVLDSRPYSATRISSTGVNSATTTPIPYAIPDVPKFERTLFDHGDRTIPASDFGGGWTVSLPFVVDYLGQSYSSIYVNANSFIAFGDRAIDVANISMSEFSAANPPLSKILISPYPSNVHRLFSEIKGASPNRTFTIRLELYIGKVWEAIFYENIPSQIDIHIGVNCGWGHEATEVWPGITGVHEQGRTQPGPFDTITNGIGAMTGLLYSTGINAKPGSGTRVVTGKTNVNRSDYPYTPLSMFSTGQSQTIGHTMIGSAGALTSTTPDYVVDWRPNDDGAWSLDLPFTVKFHGFEYTRLFVNTNSVITFGRQDGLGDNDSTVAWHDYRDNIDYRAGPMDWPWNHWVQAQLSCPGPGIYVATADNSCQRIFYKTIGSAPNRKFMVRYEGKINMLHEYGMNPTNGYPAWGDLVWEVVFYENNPNQFDVQVEKNDRYRRGDVYLRERIELSSSQRSNPGRGYYT